MLARLSNKIILIRRPFRHHLSLSKANLSGSSNKSTSDYNVPSETVEISTKVKNSEFIGTAGFTPSVESARDFIGEIKERYPDARHHCYAFAIGFGATVVHGMSDDGEPSGTAGRPMLNVLMGSGIGDCTVVVTRYFGGTKLGTGGLVKAYTGATQTCLQALKLERRAPSILVRVKGLKWEDLGRARSISNSGWKVEAEHYADDGVEVDLRLELARLEEAKRALRDMSSGRAVLTVLTDPT